MSRQPLIGFAAMLLGAACAGAVEVAQEHPRIFVKKSELPALAKRCSRGGAVAAEYSAIKRAVDGYMSGRRAMNGATLPSLCIVYQVEKALGNDVAKYVDYLKRGLWGSDGKGGGSNLPAGRQWYPRGTGSVREGYMGGRGTWYAWDAMCYDWFYDALTPEERVKYGNILGRWLHSFMGLKPNHPAKITLRYGSYLYNQTWGCCEGYAWGNYYCRDGVGCKTFVALAIHGEDTRYGRSAEEWLASWEDMVPTRFIPLIRRQGGVWTAGGGHGGATAQAVMLTLEAWRVATGQDLFGRFKGDGLRHLIYWPLYAQMPHNGYWAHLDDMFMYRTHHGLTSRVAPLAGKHFRQPVAQMMLQDLSVERRSWPYVLWYDPSVPAAALSERAALRWLPVRRQRPFRAP